MTNGVSVSDIGGVEINGVRCGLVSEYAVSLARYVDDPIAGREEPLGMTLREQDIATTAARFLNKMRAKGYSKEDTCKAFVQKIVDEAQRVKTHTEQEG